MAIGSLQFHPDRPDLVQYRVQRLRMRFRLMLHSVLEALAILSLPIVESCRGTSPRVFALVVLIGPDSSAVFQPFDLARYKLRLVLSNVKD